jgi:hypothetical protein
MKSIPQIRISVSTEGVEEIAVLYLPGKRAEAWTFCQTLLPLVQDLDESVRTQGETRSQGSRNH